MMNVEKKNKNMMIAMLKKILHTQGWNFSFTSLCEVYKYEMVENISLVVLTYDWKYLCYTIIPDTGVVSISYMEIIFFPTINF